MAVSAAAFAWVVVQAQGGCGTEAAPAEPDTAVNPQAADVKADAPPQQAAPEPAPEPEPTPEPEAKAAPAPNPAPSNEGNRGNKANKPKTFFPASKAGIMPSAPPDPPPQPNPAPQQQAAPRG